MCLFQVPFSFMALLTGDRVREEEEREKGEAPHTCRSLLSGGTG